MSAAGPSRRAVVVGGLASAAALSGCLPGSDDPQDRRTPSPRPAVQRELELRQRAADEAAAMAARYESAASAFPRQPLLARFASHHRAHEAALRPSGAETATSSPSSTPSTGRTLDPAPAGWAALRRKLMEAERRAADRRREESIAARPELARLLASISAGNAVHAALLEASA